MFRKVSLSAIVVIAMTAAASAADLPNAKAPPLVAPPVFSWTGIYAGGQAGYAWASNQTVSSAAGVPISITPSGVVGGAHIGYNYQSGSFVGGVEGDIEGTSFDGTFTNPSTENGFTDKISLQGSVRARAGVAWDHLLFYGTGGVAFADIQHNYRTDVSNTAGAGSYYSASIGRVGWTGGGGIDWAFRNDWSMRLEYRYTDYGTFADAAPFATTGIATSHHETEQAVRLGVSYHFSMFAPLAPVVAKY